MKEGTLGPAQKDSAGTAAFATVVVEDEGTRDEAGSAGEARSSEVSCEAPVDEVTRPGRFRVVWDCVLNVCLVDSHPYLLHKE